MTLHTYRSLYLFTLKKVHGISDVCPFLLFLLAIGEGDEILHDPYRSRSITTLQIVRATGLDQHWTCFPLGITVETWELTPKIR